MLYIFDFFLALREALSTISGGEGNLVREGGEELGGWVEKNLSYTDPQSNGLKFGKNCLKGLVNLKT